MKKPNHASPDQLRAWVDESLDPDTSGLVARHLDSCDQCRAELVGLRALLQEPGDAMTEVERARLHNLVAAAVSAPESATVTVIAPRRALWARLAPALGTAAVVLIAAVGIVYSNRGGDDIDTAGSAPRSAEVGTDDAADDGRSVDSAEVASDSAAGGTAAHSFESGALPPPRMDLDSGPLRRSSLVQLGKRDATISAYSKALTVEVASLAAAERLTLIADLAPFALADQFTECGQVVLDEFDAVPAYGSVGTYRGERSIALGFVTSFSGSGPLDRYLWWIWPRGSCDVPSDTLNGRVPR